MADGDLAGVDALLGLVLFVSFALAVPLAFAFALGLGRQRLEAKQAAEG
jgi:hypothetical protein